MIFFKFLLLIYYIILLPIYYNIIKKKKLCIFEDIKKHSNTVLHYNILEASDLDLEIEIYYKEYKPFVHKNNKLKNKILILEEYIINNSEIKLCFLSNQTIQLSIFNNKFDLNENIPLTEDNKIITFETKNSLNYIKGLYDRLNKMNYMSRYINNLESKNINTINWICIIELILISCFMALELGIIGRYLKDNNNII